jgi:putative acetyltransferase
VIIRQARPEDVEALARLAAASYRETFAAIIGEAGLALRQPDFFELRFAEEWPTVRLAADGDSILGFHQVRNGRLDMLFLSPAVTGRGIGAALLQDAESQGAVRLECFRDNAGARRFYEREGWRYAEGYKREFAGAERDFVAYWRP